MAMLRSLLRALVREAQTPVGCLGSGCTVIGTPLALFLTTPYGAKVSNWLLPDSDARGASRPNVAAVVPESPSETRPVATYITDQLPFVGLRGHILARVADSLTDITMGMPDKDAAIKLDIALSAVRGSILFEHAPLDEQRVLLGCMVMNQQHLHRLGVISKSNPSVEDLFETAGTPSDVSLSHADFKTMLYDMTDFVLGSSPSRATSAIDRSVRRKVRDALHSATEQGGEKMRRATEIAESLRMIRDSAIFDGASYRTRVRFEFGLRSLNILAFRQTELSGDEITRLTETWDHLLPL